MLLCIYMYCIITIVFFIFSGIIADRMDLRYFLTIGMIGKYIQYLTLLHLYTITILASTTVYITSEVHIHCTSMYLNVLHSITP